MVNKLNSIRIVFLIFFISQLSLYANTNRALYIKKYKNENKIALVIGNSNYKGQLSKLKNPINDARDIKVALENIGFDVIYLSDANLEDMDEKISKFTHKLKNGGVGLFYFAGHGLEVDNQNYLVPIGANISDKYKVKSRTLSVNEIVDRMESSATRLNMVVLDACRNDPFHRGGGGLTASSTAKGTLIAYATAPGSVARDNPNEDNGLYTKHFLEALKNNNINHADFFRDVKQKVYNASNGEQFPYVNDGTIGDFYFKIENVNVTINVNQNVIIKKQPKPEERIISNKVKVYVNTNVSNATIKILNIQKKYYQGIKLKKNKTYKFQISKNGYETEKYDVLIKKNITLKFVLDKVYTAKKKSRIPATEVSNKTWRDKDTGLMWQYKIDNKKQRLRWDSANNYCQKLTLGGYSDWELPNIDQLLNLMTKKSFSNSKSSKNKTYIKKPLLNSMDMKHQWFWSSTKKNSKEAKVGVFNDGDGYHSKLTNSKYVRCVRSKSNTYKSHTVSNTTKVWKDKDTGYIWQLDIPIKSYNAKDAKKYCKNLTLGGYTNWKQPNKEELLSLLTKNSHVNLDTKKKVTFIKKPLLKTMNAKYQWFSSDSSSGEKTWIVNFATPGKGLYYKDTSTNHIRCVISKNNTKKTENRRVSNNNKTWKDKDSGLIWQVQISPKSHKWKVGNEYCKNLTLDNSSNWRMPNKDELMSILTNNSTLNSEKIYIKKPLANSIISGFPYFWSSTKNDKSKAFIINFKNKTKFYNTVTNGGRTRCVR